MKNNEINEIIEKIKENGEFISQLPEELITKEICLDAINSGAMEILPRIPVNLRTTEICIEAIKKQPLDIEFVPNEILTEKMCLDAISVAKSRDDSWGFSVLSNIPEEFKTEKVCLEGVKKNLSDFYYVPEKLETVIVEKLGDDGQIARQLANRMKESENDYEHDRDHRDGEPEYPEKKQEKKTLNPFKKIKNFFGKESEVINLYDTSKIVNPYEVKIKNPYSLSNSNEDELER